MINTYVSHALNTGFRFAHYFSNRFNTRKTSLGVYRVGKAFYGDMGYSARLRGLDPGFNDNAYKRNIDFHGAKYVKAYYAEVYGREGGSWGCITVEKQLARTIIDVIKDGSIMIAYYPDRQWLKHSKYIQPIAGYKFIV